MDNNMEKLHMVMDESDAPFEEGECPYERTIKTNNKQCAFYNLI